MDQVNTNILSINFIFPLLVISGRGLGAKAILCNNVLHTFYIYDESVCTTKVPCPEFKEQMSVLKNISFQADFNSFTNMGSILSSGKYARFVVRKHQRLIAYEMLDEAIMDYIRSPPNLSSALAMVLAQIYKRGVYSKGLTHKCVIMIFTGTVLQQQDMEIIEELLAEANLHNVPVYAVGSGNSVQEDVLKIMSSPPREKNKNYFLQVHYETLKNVLNEEYNLLCDIETRDDEATNDYDESETNETIETSTLDSSDDDFQIITAPLISEVMNGVDSPEHSEFTKQPPEKMENYVFSQNRKVIGIVLMALLLIVLLFSGVYYCFSNKNKMADRNAPDEEDDDENPKVKNTDSVPLSVSPSVTSNKI